MGRFQLHEDDDGDPGCYQNNHLHGRTWEFVSEEGAEGSMVRFDPSNTAQQQNENQAQPMFFSQGMAPSDDHRQREVYYVIPEESYRNLQERRRGCCNLSPTCHLALAGVFAYLIWYIRNYGPPAPPRQATCLNPMGIQEVCVAVVDDPTNETDNDETLPTWKDYTDKHNAALYRSMKAYLVDTTLHVLSWILPIMLSDAAQQYQEIRDGFFPQAAKRCKLAFHPPPDDLNQRILERFPTAASQPHAFLPMVQKLDSTLWNDSSNSRRQWNTKSPVFWATQLTPGLVLPEFCKTLVEMVLPQCPVQDLPYVVLDATSSAHDSDEIKNRYRTKEGEGDVDHETLKWINHIRTRVQHWKGGGGVVVLQNVDKLPLQTLQRLLEFWRGEQDIADSITRRHFDAQNVVLVLTSVNSIGAKSMSRHVQLKGGEISDILRTTLALDIRDEIAAWLSPQNESSEQHSAVALAQNVEVLPLWYLAQDDVALALNVMISNLVESLGLNRQGLGITPAVQDEILGERRIEWLDLKALEGGQRAPQISSNGIEPVLDQMKALEVLLRKHCGKILDKTRKDYLLDYQNVNKQMILYASSAKLCSFHFV